MRSAIQISAVFAQIPWLAGANAQAVSALAAAARQVRLGKGEELIRQGQTVDYVAIIATGALESFIRMADGRQIVSSTLFPGHLMGLNAAFSGEPSRFSEVAREDTDVFTIPLDAFLAFVQADLGALRGLLAEMGLRCDHLLQLKGDQHTLSATGRVARALLVLASHYGSRAEVGGQARRVDLSQHNLAQNLGMTRQSLNGALKRLQAMKLIGLSYAAVTLLDRAGLEACILNEGGS